MIGPPRETPKSAPLGQLLKWKMVGLYEVTPGMPALPAGEIATT